MIILPVLVSQTYLPAGRTKSTENNERTASTICRLQYLGNKIIG